MMYNVTIVNPFHGRHETHMTVTADRINFENFTFQYNNYYPACEIVKIKEVPQRTLDAMDRYFTEYGTVCE